MQPINVPCFLYFLRMNLVILSIFSGRLPDCLPLIHLIIRKWGWTKIFFEKNLPRVFACIKNVVSLQRQNKNNGLWCNGNTTDSGPVILGSNPGSPAKSTSRATTRGSWTFCRCWPAFLWGRCFIEVGLLVDCVFGSEQQSFNCVLAIAVFSFI